MTPPAPPPQGACAAAVTHVSIMPGYRIGDCAVCSLGAAVTAPAGQQGAGGPNIARVYDYLLGGSHNFAADRAAAGEFLARWPDAPETMRMNRAFLGRAVRYLAAQAGIRQFLDIGSGIPSHGQRPRDRTAGSPGRLRRVCGL